MQDSEKDGAGNPPRRCTVRAATRAELSHYSQRRVTQSKCKSDFELTKGMLGGVPCQWMNSGGHPSQASMTALSRLYQAAWWMQAGQAGRAGRAGRQGGQAGRAAACVEVPSSPDMPACRSDSLKHAIMSAWQWHAVDTWPRDSWVRAGCRRCSC